MTFRLITSLLTALSMVFAPIAAQANTRASSAGVSLTTLASEAAAKAMKAAKLGDDDCDDDGILDDVDDDDDCGGGLMWIVFGGVGIALLGLIVASASGSGNAASNGSVDNGRSPGTGN